MSYKIYTPSETICDSTYPGNGCINPTLKQEVSKVWSLEFTLPPDHPEVNRITERQTEVGVSLDNGNPIFWGTVYGSKTDFFGQKTFYAEDELGYLNSAVMSPAYYENKDISEVMQLAVQTYNAQCSDKQLTLGTVQTSHTAHDITWSSNYETVLDMLQQNVVAVGGGYLRVRYVSGTRYLDYSESYGSTTQVIRIGSNLIDYVREVDRSELASVIVPLGAELPDDEQDIPDVSKRLTIYTSQRQTDRIVDNTLLAEIGTKVKTVIFEDIDDANALYSAGTSWLANQLANVTLTVCAFDLNLSNSTIDDIRLFDEVRVVSEPHGLDANFPVTEMELHLNDPASNTLTLGKSDPPKITKNQIEIAERVEVVPTEADVKREAARQAAITLENATNGYIQFVYNDQTGVLEQILIKDLTDPTHKWWRWNVNGFGYTSDGGQTYGVAITMLGQIVADYITAGVLQGIEIIAEQGMIAGWDIDSTDINKSGTYNYPDSEYDVRDIAYIRSVLLGYMTEEAALAQNPQSDINGDGHLDKNDMAILENLILRYIPNSGTYSAAIRSDNPFSLLEARDSNGTTFSAGIHGMYTKMAWIDHIITSDIDGFERVETKYDRIEFYGSSGNLVSEIKKDSEKLKDEATGNYVKLLTGSLQFYDSNDTLLTEYSATGATHDQYTVGPESVNNPASGWGDGTAVNVPAGTYIIVARAVNGGAYSYLKGRLGIKVDGSKVLHNEYYFNGAASDAEMECVYVAKFTASSTALRATVWVPETAGSWSLSLTATRL